MSWRPSEYDGLLGMTEMEEALRFWVDKVASQNGVFSRSEISVLDFPHDKRSLCIGFAHLLYRGLVQPSYPNSMFRPTQNLIKIMRTRDVWKSLPNVLTMDEWVESKLPKLPGFFTGDKK